MEQSRELYSHSRTRNGSGEVVDEEEGGDGAYVMYLMFMIDSVDNVAIIFFTVEYVLRLIICPRYPNQNHS